MSPWPLALALTVAACTDAPPPSASGEPSEDPDSTAFVGTWWRLQSLGGAAPAEGVRPVLIFTANAALHDTYDRPYPDSLHGWQIVTGDLGVGHLHAPYLRTGDSLRFAETYEYTRLSTDAEIAQARRLADALTATRTARQDGVRLVLLDAEADTLALFAADPPRPPTPLDDVEWELAEIAGAPVPNGVRADLTFTSRRLGPGEDDGFSSYGGYDGCNWYGGGYRLADEGGGRFQLTTSGPPMATARGCGEPAAGLERTVTGAFSRVASVRVTGPGKPGDRLALVDSTGAELLAFRRHEPYPVDLGALRRGRWRFQSTESPYAPPATGAEIAFADSTFEATDGCYRQHGTYTVDGDNLSIPMQSGDRAGCSEAEANAIHAVPITSGKLSVTADRLVFYDENGVATVFTRP